MAEKKEKQTAQKPEAIVYCGPSVRGIATADCPRSW